jgi:hypothetical protein
MKARGVNVHAKLISFFKADIHLFIPFPKNIFSRLSGFALHVRLCIVSSHNHSF